MVRLNTLLPLAATTAVAVSASYAPGRRADTDVLVSSQVLGKPFPYEFPRNGQDGSKLFPVEDCHGVNFEEVDIDQIQSWMSSGKLTSQQVAQCYLQRINQVDGYVNAIMEHNPDLMTIAAALDEERKQGNVRGPLHGVPFIVKDNIGTKDKMETTAGSWSLLGSVLPRDSHVIHRLRKAGALLLGKATLSEWADMRTNNYSEGYSGRGGQCRSAYNLVVNPGGSSSGSGVAVGANMIPFALGTETDGSVVNPASRNGIVGIKPTVGLTSRAGVVPESLNQDTVGVHAKTVRDATYVLDAIYGVDKRDNATSAQVGKVPPKATGYKHFLTDKSALRGARFGVPWDSFWRLAPATQQQQLGELIRLIRDAGAEVVNGTEIPTRKLLVSPDGWNWDYGTTRGYPNESEYTYIKVDFYNNIRTYLSELNNTDIKSLEDIVQYNYDNDGAEGGNPGTHPAFASGQDGFLASLATKGEINETYWQALNFCRRASREDGIDAALYNKGDKVDLLLIPTEVAQAPQVAAQAGYPIINLPAGVTPETGMPFGLGLMGTAFSEATLVRYASAIEDLQKTSGTQQKRQLPTWRNYKSRIIPVPF
ncbi:uncharacterized protein PFL1_05673 [Pseudozyma flocculosa PF-1]|uniref:Amidase domain-containing protein n=2 Tax=Pseudozyma flocculosa TaxID=84751 RepID=A0A061H330_9BASI|nr:uncharacterized protein PFL1_05673 [Pseudozyma flocculosa PF-1]EPQ26694.1 hypothetical protein PFL1_05673 [Pseudozyma flocculosa PF-1]SPO40988.1 probable amidases [Pseudozyma flocculosa]